MLQMLPSNGGVLSGPLAMGIVSCGAPESGTFWECPREGNIIVLSGVAGMTRLNYVGDSRFFIGSMVTLIFESAGGNNRRPKNNTIV